MGLRKFYAADMPEALAKVRAEIGPDAVILDTKKLDHGLEITAMGDHDMALANRSDKRSNPSRVPDKDMEKVALPEVVDAYLNKARGSNEHESPSRDSVFKGVRNADQVNSSSEFPDPEVIDSGWTFSDSDGQANTKEETSFSQASKYKPSNRLVYKQQEPMASTVFQKPSINQFQGSLKKSSLKESSLKESLESSESSELLERNSLSAVGENRESRETAVEAELGNIRSMLQQWIGSSAWTDYSAKSPLQARLWENYSAMGIDSDLIPELISAAENEPDLKSAWRNSLAVLTRQIQTKTESNFSLNVVEDGGVYAFVGATGSGKTTTIGKLATHCVLDHGADSVALISTDRFRLAAHEQLKTLGRILGVQVFVANNNRELNSLLTALSDKRTVLIDTAGLSRGAGQSRSATTGNTGDQESSDKNESLLNFERQLSMLATASQAIKTLMVLSATSQKSVLLAELSAYQRLSLSGLVVTKTDEATSLGEFLSVAIRSHLPTLYETFGQQLPDDIAIAKNYKLVSHAVALSNVEELNKQNLLSGFSHAVMTQQGLAAHALNVGAL